jgi:hypothetical protein
MLALRRVIFVFQAFQPFHFNSKGTDALAKLLAL